LNEVLGQPPIAPGQSAAPVAEEQPVDPLVRFREETLARMAPRLERLEAYGSTILAVVEGDAKEPAAKMRETLTVADPGQSLKLEVLDRAAYAAIQRLIEAGVISWGNCSVTPMYRAATPGDSEREARQRRMREARGILEQAERKRRMAELLIANGFNAESHAPLREAHEMAIKAFAVFTGDADGASTPFAATIHQIAEKIDSTPESGTPELAVCVTELFQKIEERFNLAMLECAA
jgi:hypothetical protein